MTKAGAAALRKVVFNIHLWVALILFLPLVGLGLSGSALMFQGSLNQLHSAPPKVAAVPGQAALTPSQLLAAAGAVLPPGSRLQTLRLPPGSDEAASVVASSGGGGPAKVIWLHPATAQVVGSSQTTSPLVRFADSLHGHLLIPGPGRSIVGYAGVAMLLLSLSGIWLWWPRGAFLKGFRWRRTPDTLDNLHHVTGFWLSLPLALVSVTGILIAFPVVTSTLFGGPAGGLPQGPPRERSGPAPTPAHRLTPEAALSAAAAARPDARPTAISLPGVSRPGPADPTSRNAWRIEMANGAARQTLLVEDATGQVRVAPRPRRTGPIAMIRRIHEGEGGGQVWRGIVFLTGLLPLLLAFTGITLWARNELRRRRSRTAGAQAA